MAARNVTLIDDDIYRLDGGVEDVYILKNPDYWFLAPGKFSEQLKKQLKNKRGELPVHGREGVGPQHLFSHPVLRLTNRCNLSCTHCYQDINGSQSGGMKDLDFEEAKKFLNFIKEKADSYGTGTLRTIQLFGGEPTLYPKFREILQFCEDFDLYKIRVSTNATTPFFRAPGNQAFFENQTIEWRVSMESHLEKEHNTLRPFSFKKSIHGLERMIGAGANVTAKTVVTPGNLDSLEETILFYHDLGVNNFTYRVLFEQGSARKNSLTRSFDDYDVAMKLLGIVRRRPYLARFLQPSPFGRWLKSIFVRGVEAYPQIYYYVDSDGLIYPNDKVCEIPGFALGSIYNDKGYALERLREFQKNVEINLPVCKGCPVENYCFKGNLGLLYEDNPGLEGYFRECDSVKRLVPGLMSLGEEGALLAKKMYE